jgi:beta-galactosidase
MTSGEKRATQGGVTPVSFGTAYYPDHWPEAEWGRDLDRMVAAGLTAVRFGEFSWSWFEPEPGQYDFSGYDRFVDLVEERGLELCLCTPTATPPPWMDVLFPDGRLEDMHGRRCLSVRHFWNWNHAGAWAKAEESITRLVERYARRPCLWGWQIDNEPNYAERIGLAEPESMYDWSPAGRREFAAWLERRHGRIADLNAAWWTNFWSQRVRDWTEAATPRGRVNPHAWLDFMRWREANLAAQVRRQADLLRRLNPARVRIGCNIPETGVNLSVNIGQDYWAQAAGLDWVGTDLYQATGDRSRDLARLACSTDLLRGAAEAAGAEFFISETQAGPHRRAWPNGFAGEGFGPDYLRQCAETYATRGATRVWWFLWRPTLGGHEIGMNGVQDLEGGDTPRTAMVTRLVALGETLARRRQRWERRPRALVHYSRDSLLQRSAFTAGLSAWGDNLDGWHGLLESAGWRVDFVNDAQLLAGAATEAALVVAPFSAVMSDALVAALAAGQGALVAGPHTGCFDEHGRWRPRWPEALAQRLGLRPGLWRDGPPARRLAGAGEVAGWAEVANRRHDTKVVQRFTTREPAVIACDRDRWLAYDAGAVAWAARSAVRRRLADCLGLTCPDLVAVVK